MSDVMLRKPESPGGEGPPAGSDRTERAPRALSLQALGRACATHPARVIAVWLAALAALLALSAAYGGIFNDNVNLPGTESYAGLQLLDAEDPAAGGYTGLIVMRAEHGSLRADQNTIGQALGAVGRLPDVRSVANPLAPGSGALSANGQIAYATVHFSVEPKTLGSSYIPKLHRAMAPVARDAIEVQYGGGLDALVRPAANDKSSELIGLAVALIVLLCAFGSLIASFLPLLCALIAVGCGVSLLGMIAALITFGTAAPTLALMIGLGVGIDYSLFLTTRFRQRIAEHATPAQAAAFTVGTSGHAVLVAATTVSLALLGLYVSGLTFIGQLGLAAVFAVASACAAALTLAPALLGLAGRRIDRVALRRPVAEAGSEGDHWHRYARLISRRAWWFLAAGVIVLGVLAIPLFSMQLGHIDDGADPTSFTDRQAYDLIAQGFGAGANGPLTILVQTHGAHESASAIAGQVSAALGREADVAHMSALRPLAGSTLLLGTLIPKSKPQAQATRSLFERLLAKGLPKALSGSGAKGYITGGTASQEQFLQTVSSRLVLVIGVVVALAFLILMATFRSLAIALKAAILNLLSIGAAYGVIVAVFQWGWGRSLLGVSENVPIESYVPVIMFAIVFGLSMDYEVFLLSRVREAWLACGDNTTAVATGLARTARVITSAALIMAAVFSSFVLSTNIVIKMLALGLAASVLVDASIVRMVLVPATMTLLGGANWWLPGWLERLLPHIAAEGEG